MGFFRRKRDTSRIPKEELNAIRALVAETYGLAQALEAALKRTAPQGTDLSMALTTAFGADLTTYAVLFAYADGEVRPSEVNAINELLGTRLDQAACEQVARQLTQTSATWDWTEYIPVSFKNIVYLCHVAAPQNPHLPNALTIGTKILDIYNRVGKAIIGSDGDVDAREAEVVEALYARMNMHMLDVVFGSV